MNCPLCIDQTLDITHRHGIELDICPKCRGIWLDRGEIDRLLAEDVSASPPPPAPSSKDRGEDDRRRSDDDGDRDKKRKKKKKKKSLASRLSDAIEDAIDEIT